MSEYPSYEDQIKARHARDGGIYDPVEMARDIGLLLTSLDLLQLQNSALCEDKERYLKKLQRISGIICKGEERLS